MLLRQIIEVSTYVLTDRAEWTTQTYLARRINNIQIKFLPFILHHFLKRILDCWIIRIDEMRVDKLNCQRWFTWRGKGKRISVIRSFSFNSRFMGEESLCLDIARRWRDHFVSVYHLHLISSRPAKWNYSWTIVNFELQLSRVRVVPLHLVRWDSGNSSLYPVYHILRLFSAPRFFKTLKYCWERFALAWSFSRLRSHCIGSATW